MPEGNRAVNSVVHIHLSEHFRGFAGTWQTDLGSLGSEAQVLRWSL